MPTISKLVVHVGLAQSGSTTLQRHIFNQRDFGFALLTTDRIETVRKYIEAPLAGEFDASNCAKFFSHQFAEYQDDSLVPVISNEGLADRFLTMQDNFHAETYAHRLYEAFGRCKIVLIIREQSSHLVSKYRKNLESKGRSNVSLTSFLRDWLLAHRVQTDCDSIYLPYLRHDNLAKLYWMLFGPENVLIIPLEMMEHQPTEFIRRLNEFCGAKIPSSFIVPRANPHGVGGLSSFYRVYNTIYSPMSISMLWFLNRRPRWGEKWAGRSSFVAKKSNTLQKKIISALWSMRVITAAKMAREKEQQIEIVRSMLGNYFAESNQNLSKMIEIDLARFGYTVGDRPTSAAHSEQRHSEGSAQIVRTATG